MDLDATGRRAAPALERRVGRSTRRSADRAGYHNDHAMHHRADRILVRSSGALPLRPRERNGWACVHDSYINLRISRDRVRGVTTSGAPTGEGI